ncbi:anti-sigma factor [Caenimonas aquaedulcis]|uniref:Anti-sigma factor n=1 Tax=Caenimonas aquaedulcis TaxID=2793270 RepID=A0A931MH57_9BURK|nr:anti-sigma factor [Caenimonas aquaedulcis]MBG9388563.1 anti-sigma factor [Caenimonas aquaedulcis]
MNLNRHPELVDRLAASYALGTLRGGARRRFEQLARQDASIRAPALLWQERFAAMTELQRADMPSANVWKRIQNEIEATRPTRGVAASEPARQGIASWWRGAALAGAFATVAAVGVSVSVLRAQPEVSYVAVLSDDKATASLLVTVDPKHNTMTIKRVGGYQVAADKSLQLWALPEAGGPRSLAVLGTDGVARISTAQSSIRQMPVLAVSLEPKGGVQGAPTGPVLFKGALLQAP